MKLRTEMSNATGKWLPFVTWGDPLGAGLNHDAAAAHALMQAIEECCTPFTRPHVIINLERRASELMKQWGFDSGEDGE